MKQHITAKQWDDITDEQKMTLRFDKDIVWDGITIGKMIEFLGNDWLQLVTIYCEECEVTEYPDNKGLCDELWKAVKHKLNL